MRAAPRRIVFLDFDGVVVCLPRVNERLARHRDAETGALGGVVRDANPEPVAQLNRILEATGADVVVSSSWRLHHPIAHLRGTLARSGFAGRVVDTTPSFRGGFDLGGQAVGRDRGHEIAAWLRRQPGTGYVVLDDDSDRGPIPEERWILVRDGWTTGGLQAHHADAAIAVLLGARDEAGR